MFIFDAHLDLAMNALEWNRDLSRPIEEIRHRERTMRERPDRRNGTVSFAEMRRGRVGLCVATQIARYVRPDNPLPGWHSPEQAWGMTQGQLAWYRAMEERGELTPIVDRAALDRHLEGWMSGGDAQPNGYVLSL
jgi:membrane dipeptidase